MTAAAVVLALFCLYLSARLRRLERRLEDLGDRFIDWRLELGRNHGALEDRVDGLSGVTPAHRPDPTRSQPASLIQIQARPPATSGGGPAGGGK